VLTYEADAARHLYLVAPTGRVRVNGQDAKPRDGVADRPPLSGPR